VPAGYRVRVCRRRETSALAVVRALPAGASRASSQAAFLAAVAESPALGSLRADGLASVLEVARHLAWTASWDTMTTRPTWDYLIERTGRSRATVHRALVRLRAAGLLGVVATGRSARYQPAKRDAGVAEAAVYVLCVPSPLELLAGGAVDESETPTGSPVASGTRPPHARVSDGSTEPLRGRSWAAARPSAPRSKPEDAAPRPADPAGSGRCGPDGRRLAAGELRGRLAVLRRISTAHVAWAVGDFVTAGWSAYELGRAIDTRPDGTRWPHDGATGVDNVGAWLVHRLGAWRGPDGAPLPSPGRVSLELARQRAAARRAEREQAAAAPAVDLGEALAAVHAIRDQIIDRGRRPWQSS
jgi:hypothetical protein